MASRLPPEDAAPLEKVVLYWRYPDGTVASGGHPLPRDQAEHLARVYGSMYPEQSFWLEPVKLEDTLAYARVRRRRPQASARKT
jgi:hypothetical protein